MTRVEFYFNVANKLDKTAELCQKALDKGRQLTIYTQDEAMSSQVQSHLWTYSNSSFLANSKIDESNNHFSPIVIDFDGQKLIQDDVLINLHNVQPIFFSRFRYLVELVSYDDADKAAARARFRFYKDRGYDIKSTDSAVA